MTFIIYIFSLIMFILISYIDIKKSEIQKEVLYVFIGFLFIIRAVSFDFIPLLLGIASFGIGLILFYSGFWSGGDAKLLTVFGLIFGDSLSMFAYSIAAVLFYSGISCAIKKKPPLAPAFLVAFCNMVIWVIL